MERVAWAGPPLRRTCPWRDHEKGKKHNAVVLLRGFYGWQGGPTDGSADDGWHARQPRPPGTGGGLINGTGRVKVWMMYQITVSRVFSAAHAIRLYDGTLEPVHGHNWSVRVTIATEKLDEIDVVMDFHELGKSVDRLIGPIHNRNLNDTEPFAGGRVNPTAERVARWIGDEVAKDLHDGVRLHSVEVGEAPGCTATYTPGGKF